MLAGLFQQLKIKYGGGERIEAIIKYLKKNWILIAIFIGIVVSVAYTHIVEVENNKKITAQALKTDTKIFELQSKLNVLTTTIHNIVAEAEKEVKNNNKKIEQKISACSPDELVDVVNNMLQKLRSEPR